MKAIWERLAIVGVILAISPILGMAPLEAKIIPRVTNFVILVDQSGSMFDKYFGMEEVKAILAKKILLEMNDLIPDLDYTGAIQVFAPETTLIGPQKYDRTFFRNAIRNLPESGKVYGNLTPLGHAILHLDKIMNGFFGKTTVIIVSDGRSNQGMSPLKAAKQIYAEYTNICFDVISLADNQKGRETLQEISEVNDCIYNVGRELLSDPVLMDDFIKEIFYLDVSSEAPEEVLTSSEEAETATSEAITLRGIHFDLNKYDIKSMWALVLDEAIETLFDRPEVRIIIEGHTDWSGPEQYNQSLSEKRAKAVYDYLRSKGIASDRMKTIGYGETIPEVSNLTPEGRAINRRVVIQMED